MKRMVIVHRAAPALLALFVVVASASEPVITPTANLLVDGIPPIPKVIADRVAAYTEFRATAVVAWHPSKAGMVVRRRASNTNQLFYLPSAGAVPEQLTDFPDAVGSASFQPKKGEFILFEKGRGGNEVFQIFRMDLASKTVIALTSDKERASFQGWNRAGDRILYTTVGIDRNNTSRKPETRLHLVDPLNPDSTQLVATFERTGYGNFRFAPGDKRLVFGESVSVNESNIWILDLETGERSRVTPDQTNAKEKTVWTGARFSRDGKRLYAISDQGSEFRRLVTIDLDGGKVTPLTAHVNRDVEGFAVSEKSKRIAFTTNEDGASVLRFLELPSHQELPRPALVPGQISGVRFKGGDDGEDGEIGDGAQIALNIVSSRSPGDVYSYHLETKKLTRWTHGGSGELSPLDFVEPQLVKWKSFDGLDISGFHYAPDASKHPGKRPVIISIHGGPEGQARPNFLGRNNYFVNELGIAMLFPNVRGSIGFGKTFVALDNGTKREDAVKDIGALLDWIKDQPGLDASRVLVTGGSYGGYMSLAVSTHYADRIAGAIDVVGISNFITFLTNTETYRRDLRRVEYGDERDPAMRAFFEKISPLNNAARITKPLFVIQGKNDPRVPYTEAEQIVSQLKKQKTPVWFLMANDEGHGFAKKSNQDFQFAATVMFLKETILK
jgi:dipeptidyl aminopeptidase/acylaminoacyl peptidase